MSFLLKHRLAFCRVNAPLVTKPQEPQEKLTRHLGSCLTHKDSSSLTRAEVSREYQALWALSLPFPWAAGHLRGLAVFLKDWWQEPQQIISRHAILCVPAQQDASRLSAPSKNAPSSLDLPLSMFVFKCFQFLRFSFALFCFWNNIVRHSHPLTAEGRASFKLHWQFSGDKYNHREFLLIN